MTEEVTQTPAEILAANEAAAAELAGNKAPDGSVAVVADTAESLAARAEAESAAAAAEAAKETPAQAKVREAKEAYEAAVRDNETPEEKTARETAEAEAAKPAAEEGAAEWLVTESKEFNASLSIMKAAGMTPEEAGALFDNAAQTGDLSTVDQAALIEQVGEDKAALVMAGFTQYVEAEGQAILARTKAAHDTVGGSENWQKMVSWARVKAAGDTAFKAEVEGITEMLNSGNAMHSKMAADAFKNLYNADKTNSTITANAAAVEVNKTPVAPTRPTIIPMSAMVYSDAIDTANRTLNGAAREAKFAELRQQRALGRSQGL